MLGRTRKCRETGVKARLMKILIWALVLVISKNDEFCAEAWSSSLRRSSVVAAPAAATTSRTISTTALFYKSQDDDGSMKEKEEPDWRDFRAKLVQQYQQSQSLSSVSDEESLLVLPNDSQNSQEEEGSVRSGWAYESQDVIEKGSLIVSSPHQDFACGGLRQQYFHKCVVLVVEHTPQFTKGIVLNRPVQHTLIGDGHVWHFSGDVQGFSWTNPPPSTTCLHFNKEWRDYSDPIVNDIQQIPYESAWDLIDMGSASLQDFWIGTGYAGWRPGQLQQELDRGNWIMVATDKHTIRSLLRSDNDRDADSSGIDMWAYLLGKINRSDLVEEGAMLEFEDTMLKEWMKDLSETVRDPATIASSALRLPPPPLSDEASSGTTSRPVTPGTSSNIDTAESSIPLTTGFEPGTILRSTKPFLLNNQVLHQALVLIVQNDFTCCAGVVLNRPSSNSAEINSKVSLRYGGRYGIGDPDSNAEKPELWLYSSHHVGLSSAQVGTPVGKRDGIWNCTARDAETAMEMGLAQPSDFLNVLGLTVWAKPPYSSHNIADSIVELHEGFEVVSPERVPLVWDILTQQVPLSKDTLANNLKAANFAWKIAADPSTKDSVAQVKQKQSKVESTSLKQQRLANLALERWIRMFLTQLEPKNKP